MSTYLTDKSNFIISEGSTPTASEIARQFRPQSLALKFDSLASENSGRTDDGSMHIEWVYRKIRKLEIEMPPCTSDVATVFLALVQGQEYYITYFDLLTNAERTMHVYTSNSSADCYSGVIMNGLYQRLQFNAIELAGE